MASFFRNKVLKDVGVTPVTALTTAANTRMTIIGMSFANLTESIVLLDVKLTDATPTTGYYAKQVLIPPNSSLRLVNGGEKLILAESNSLIVNANVAAGLDVIISYVELV
jgi:hypothetical protein